MTKILMVLFVACGLQMSASAQENSPYSRYGIGDLVPAGNVLSRSMGGISAGIATNNHQRDDVSRQPPSVSINFINPASVASNRYFTVLDVGTDISYRILKSSNPPKKFTSANTYVSYLQLAFPLTTPKMAKKGIDWGLNIGLRPISKINYKIESNSRGTSGDSLNTLYEGTGGTNMASLGTAVKYKDLSIGINAGYMFGNKNYSTRITIINDSVYHYQSTSDNRTSFNGLLLTLGVQYELNLDKNKKTNKIPRILRFGLYGNMQQNLKAKADITDQTVFLDQNGNVYRIDSVYSGNDVKGKIKYPAKIGVGFVYHDMNWMYGADFEYGNWANYRSYGDKDFLQNNWTFRAGAQYHPRKENTPASKYFRFVKYRAGFYYGTDYVNINKKRPEYGFTLGTGMPLTSIKQQRRDGKVVLNTGLEFGSRGNKQTNLRENVVRFSIGISMNAVWFQKPKYN